MSEWAVAARSTARRAFFSEEIDDERGHVTSRRASRSRRAELVVDESDDGSPHEDLKLSEARGLELSRGATTSRGGKLDELAAAEVVSPSTGELERAASSDLLASHYVHWLVLDFIQKRYPTHVAETFLKENPPPPNAIHKLQQVQNLHGRVVSRNNPSSNQAAPLLKQVLAAWDVNTHNRILRSQHRSSGISHDAPVPAQKSKPSRSTSAGSKRKPQLSVAIMEDSSPSFRDETPQDGGEFNRLNHPGHTPKAQETLLAAVLGEPGSTPKASLSELIALGFEDVDDGPCSVPLIPTPKKSEIVDSSDDDELSKYARRKRAAQRHNKHVFVGEAGRTPTKEYVFFRETPPHFVTETIEAAEEVLRSIGGDPDSKRQHLQPIKAERFVELQSSDVAKYSVGQRVEKLGAQRNVSGLVSKLYGSRQCGTAGPGTVVIDTWNGSDTAPTTEGEER